MQLPGNNKLMVSGAVMCRLVEDAINASLKDGEDYVHVSEVKFTYMKDIFEISISTDKPTYEVANVES